MYLDPSSTDWGKKKHKNKTLGRLHYCLCPHRAMSSHLTIMGSSRDTEERSAISSRLNAAPEYAQLRSRPVGGGKQAFYIPSDVILEIANTSFGFDRWSCEIKRLEVDYAVQVSGGGCGRRAAVLHR